MSVRSVMSLESKFKSSLSPCTYIPDHWTWETYRMTLWFCTVVLLQSDHWCTIIMTPLNFDQASPMDCDFWLRLHLKQTLIDALWFWYNSEHSFLTMYRNLLFSSLYRLCTAAWNTDCATVGSLSWLKSAGGSIFWARVNLIFSCTCLHPLCIVETVTEMN